MPLSDALARENDALIARFAGAPGPWTAITVSTMMGLGIEHRISHDQGHDFPSWVWKYESPEFSLDTSGHQEPNDGLWHYVAELAGPLFTDTAVAGWHGPRRRHTWVIPAIMFVDDMERFLLTCADLLNHGLERARKDAVRRRRSGVAVGPQ